MNCLSTETLVPMIATEPAQCQLTLFRPSLSDEINKLLKNYGYEYDSEYFSKVFSWNGGELRNWITDDYLEIPRGAIPEGQEWEIQCKIHTCLDKFDNIFLKGERKQFRSCVLEYVIKDELLCNAEKQFLTRVVINLRHSVADECARNTLRVFCLEDDNQVIEIFQQHKIWGRDPWFEFYEDFLRIHTYHFCKFTCVCVGTENEIRDIQYFTASLYGKITRVFNENTMYVADLSFALWAHTKDGVECLPEFRNSYITNMKAEQSRTQLVWCDVTIPVTDLKCNYQMQVEFILDDEDKKVWKFKQISDSAKQEFTINEVIPCSIEIKNPIKCCQYYLLIGNKSDLAGAIIVKFIKPNESNFINQNHESDDRPSLVVSKPTKAVFSLMFRDDLPGKMLASKRKNSTLSANNIMDIARRISPESILDLGLKMDFEITEIKQIESNNQSNIRRAIFDIINDWCDKSIQEGVELDKLVDKLINIFKQCACREAATVLKQFHYKQ